ncbi:MAG: hypothetical protein HY703_13055 [Gemmatimonadetes bacterium]|nr:hypothetical protein [Gemmatimonadota bacterium]
MKTKTSGPAAAAILSAGLGSLVLGIAVLLAVVSTDIKDFLNWWNPAGPLSGKSGVAVIAWLASWAALHFIWRNREVAIKPIAIAAVILIALGFLGTFPPFFEAFEPH